MSKDELMEIGRNIALTWGAECYDCEVTANSVIFSCIENGEEFITEIEIADLKNYK